MDVYNFVYNFRMMDNVKMMDVGGNGSARVKFGC